MKKEPFVCLAKCRQKTKSIKKTETKINKKRFKPKWKYEHKESHDQQIKQKMWRTYSKFIQHIVMVQYKFEISLDKIDWTSKVARKRQNWNKSKWERKMGMRLIVWIVETSTQKIIVHFIRLIHFIWFDSIDLKWCEL